MDDKIATTAEAVEADALPRLREVHTDPSQKAPDTGAIKHSAEPKSPARWAYERLILYIQNFEKTLDSEHEVAMGFAGSDSGVIRIEGMGYFDPDIITFYGSDLEGTKTQLIQHVTQLSVMLRALPKKTPTVAANRIGFRLAAALDDTVKDADQDAAIAPTS